MIRFPSSSKSIAYSSQKVPSCFGTYNGRPG
jgi:hypothetical protein